MNLDIWQEMDCPVGADWDLFGDAMLFQGQRFKCPWCNGEHIAGETAVVHTYIVRTEGGPMECLGLPKDAAELAAWKHESAA